jgi:membrane protein implicated in regulation of membrane protease activity
MLDSFKTLLGISTDAEAFYWLMALLGTFFFIVKIVINLVGKDKSASDIDLDGSHDFFSIETILSFLKVAGWIGVLCFRLTSLSPMLVLLASLVSGTIAFFVAATTLKHLRHLEDDGTMNLENAVGKTGVVYLSLPGLNQGTGQIQVEVQGRFATLDAKSDKPIKTGEKVFVYAVENNCLLVVPKGEEETIAAVAP